MRYFSYLRDDKMVILEKKYLYFINCMLLYKHISLYGCYSKTDLCFGLNQNNTVMYGR
jgi:hypothetical protein